MLCNDILMDNRMMPEAGIPLPLRWQGDGCRDSKLAPAGECFYDSNKQVLIH
jgi:hypothetical protein